MSDAENEPEVVVPASNILVELGNARPHEKLGGVLTPLRVNGPAVSYLNIPAGPDAAGNELYSFPDVHDDSLFPEEIASALAGIPDGDSKRKVRRLLIDGHLNHPSGVKGLPNHAAAVAVIHPGGFWNEVSLPADDPTWVWSNNAELQKFLAEYYGCAEGRPADLEDTHYTQYGASVFPPGAIPDPASGIVALHTSIGRDIQALGMGGFGYLGTVGTASATGTNSLTGSAETGVSHASSDSIGNVIVVGPNASGTGSKVWGLITANTSGTTPVYTVDQWYNAASPGGAAGATPNATAFYQVLTGPQAIFVALTTDATAPSFGGTGGTQDAATIVQTLTSEINAGGGGLNRKIGPIGHTAAAATWTNTPVFTANGSDALPKTVAKAALCVSNVGAGGGLVYMTAVSPTATISASGDQLTLTWTFTMT